MPIWCHHQMSRIIRVAVKNYEIPLTSVEDIIRSIPIFLWFVTQNTASWFLLQYIFHPPRGPNLFHDKDRLYLGPS